MVCCMFRISLISSMCEGIYRCIISHDCNEWFLMCRICKYGEICAEDGIFVMFLGNGYFFIY